MPDWLIQAFPGEVDISIRDLAVRQLAALLLGCVVAGIYRLTHGRGGNQSIGLAATLVLLTVLIGTVTLVVGGNVARAFSLAGALAIVRFRTVVEDTRDTAFVIFAVTVGMAVGAGLWTVALVCIPVTGCAALVFSLLGWRPSTRPGMDFVLKLRIGAGHEPEVLLGEVLARHLARWRITALATARQGAALDLSYAVRLRDAGVAVPLVSELSRVAGVQDVELRQS